MCLLAANKLPVEYGLLLKNCRSFNERITDKTSIFLGGYFNEEKVSGPQIVAKLRQGDVLIGKGKTVPEVCKEIEVSQQTYYRWRQKYGGMSPDMIKQLRALQKENAQLKRLVADQALDISILKVAAEGNF